jgi:tetratricopeptide (TPR) repeat protein
MKKTSPVSVLILLVMACFTLATLFVPRAENWNGHSQSANVFTLLFGEGRRLFANQFFIMGDVYFHSGFYPSIFDQQEEEHDVAAPAHGQAEEAEATGEDFRGPPKDWIDRLDRNFTPNRHTHLSSGGATGTAKAAGVQEILPWLKLAADTNPQMIETYTVAAYWLRKSLNKPHEAEAFLQEGLRQNPGNYQLLFDLGRLYNENYHDTVRASNVWVAALRKWQEQSDADKTNSLLIMDGIADQLAHLEENSGNWNQAINYLEMAKKVSRAPDAVQERIDEIKSKLAAQSAATNSPAH